MALANYSNLQASIADYLHRGDLTAQIADFITLAEKRIVAEMEFLAQRTQVTLTQTIGSRNTALPSGFVNLLSMYYAGGSPKLAYVEFEELYKYDDSSGQPEYYAIDGSNFVWNCSPTAAHTVTCEYSKHLQLATDTTNWVLTNHPGLYLYGALLEATPFIGDDPRIMLWQQAYKEAKALAMKRDWRNNNDAVMKTDLAQSVWRNGRYNFLTG